jgi:hypothetical protein
VIRIRSLFNNEDIKRGVIIDPENVLQVCPAQAPVPVTRIKKSPRELVLRACAPVLIPENRIPVLIFYRIEMMKFFTIPLSE